MSLRCPNCDADVAIWRLRTRSFTCRACGAALKPSSNLLGIFIFSIIIAWLIGGMFISAVDDIPGGLIIVAAIRLSVGLGILSLAANKLVKLHLEDTTSK